jgi:hypothetical protein
LRQFSTSRLKDLGFAGFFETGLRPQRRLRLFSTSRLKDLGFAGFFETGIRPQRRLAAVQHI